MVCSICRKSCFYALLLLCFYGDSVEMPGLEPGSRRVDFMIFMCSILWCFGRSVKRTQKPMYLASEGFEIMSEAPVISTLDGLTPPDSYRVSERRWLSRLGDGRCE